MYLKKGVKSACVGFLCQSFKVCLDKAACKNVIVIVIVIAGSVIVIVID